MINFLSNDNLHFNGTLLLCIRYAGRIDFKFSNNFILSFSYICLLSFLKLRPWKRVIEYNYVFLDWKIWIYVVVSNGRISCQIENCVGPARLPNQFFLFSGLHQGHKQISTKSLAISDYNCEVLVDTLLALHQTCFTT